MEYEIVTLEEKTAVGISARTSNLSPDAGAVIGGLWNRFYSEDVYASIPEKVSGKALGIYTEYARDGASLKGEEAFDGKAESAAYTVVVACETAGSGQGAGEEGEPAPCEPWKGKEEAGSGQGVGEEGKGAADKLGEKGYTVLRIPAGRYAKFVIHGDMVQAVAAAWQEIWQMDLPRTFRCDFEEYQNDSMEQAEIHIYVGLMENDHEKEKSGQGGWTWLQR